MSKKEKVQFKKYNKKFWDNVRGWFCNRVIYVDSFYGIFILGNSLLVVVVVVILLSLFCCYAYTPYGISDCGICLFNTQPNAIPDKKHFHYNHLQNILFVVYWVRKNILNNPFFDPFLIIQFLPRKKIDSDFLLSKTVLSP